MSDVRLLWNWILAPFTSNITAVNQYDPFCQNGTGHKHIYATCDWLSITFLKVCMNKVRKLAMYCTWSLDSEENRHNCYHQRSDFKAKMHQIRFLVELRPRPRWGSLQRSPRPFSWILGALFLRGREMTVQLHKRDNESKILVAINTARTQKKKIQ